MSESEQDVYDEKQRLALEELLTKGTCSYRRFLLSENIPEFLNEDEINSIDKSRRSPRVCGDSTLSFNESQNLSSAAYSPQLWDVEPPVLDLGWPSFTAGSYRGLTRAVAHFQPGHDGCLHSCKVAARHMIRSAKEVHIDHTPVIHEMLIHLHPSIH